MYTEKDLAMIAKRENNNKRNYLVVDPLQGKHVPVSPTKALNLFYDLAECVKTNSSENNYLVIGFAETATAIGVQVALSLNCDYIQTTREIIDNVEYLFFSEEHSHATEQKLVKDDIDKAFEKCSHILFVEDEVTTGKTILNIVDIIQKKYANRDICFSVASLLNGMGSEHLDLYEKRGIKLYYLVKTDHSTYGQIADTFRGDGQYFLPDFLPDILQDIEEKHEDMLSVKIITADGAVNTRRLVKKGIYESACDKLWEIIKKELNKNVSENVSEKESILVMGTEECMYPALYIGSQAEKMGYTVKSHSTTRSPIAVSSENNYPLHKRNELRSLYDENRVTFIYDIDSYDRVFVITDATLENKGMTSLINALKQCNNDITIVQWK